MQGLAPGARPDPRVALGQSRNHMKGGDGHESALLAAGLSDAECLLCHPACHQSHHSLTWQWM